MGLCKQMQMNNKHNVMWSRHSMSIDDFIVVKCNNRMMKFNAQQCNKKVNPIVWWGEYMMSWTFTLFSLFPFPVCDYPYADHMINTISSFLYSPCHSDIPPYPCLSCSDLISLLSQIISLIILCFYLSSYPHKPLIYLIIFVLSTFRPIVLCSVLFLLDVSLHLSLGIILYCHSY
jgi:hypothetical protein